MRGRLITIEGIDGAGKTTLIDGLVAEFKDRSIQVRALREPGGVQLAERIRELVKDPAITVSPRAEALLYAAARAQLVQQLVQPLLEQGVWVLLDRFVDSSLAYQGAGRKLGIETIAAINEFATGGLQPDRTVLLVIDPALARARQQDRGEPCDRLEAESEQFFSDTVATYHQLAQSQPGRIRAIDAAAAPNEVLAAAMRAIEDLLSAK